MNNLYKVYTKIIGADRLFERSAVNVQVSGDESVDLIRDKINLNQPLMISRFGATELNCLLNYYFINKSFIGNLGNVLSGIPYFLNFKKNILDNMNILSGFFPPTIANIERFCEMSINDLQEIDILGSWLTHERYLYKFFKKDHIRVRLGDLTPLKYLNPWSSVLEGKTVLVIHPFEETIINQYKNRKFLFKDPRVLPEFELKTLKAVQSIAGSDTKFNNWFEALDSMKNRVDIIDFDIAIIGCGAYGMPLAAHIKRAGKQAVHLGGETQTLFGIKGKRWEAPSYNYQERFYNEYWSRPSESEVPERAQKVEDGCYW